MLVLALGSLLWLSPGADATTIDPKIEGGLS